MPSDAKPPAPSSVQTLTLNETLTQTIRADGGGLTDVIFTNPDFVVVHQSKDFVVGGTTERRDGTVLAQVSF